jgi:hypothetical protein
MDVVLHVGAHRTASTTFQKTLGANGAALAEAGVVYWGPKCTRAGLFDGLIGAARRLDAAACWPGCAVWRCGAAGGTRGRADPARQRGKRAWLHAGGAVGGGFYADAGRACGGRGGGVRRAPADDRDGDARAGCVVAVGRGVLARAGRDHATGARRRLAGQPRDWRDVIGDVAR